MLEDADIYRHHHSHSKTEERLRRKMIRDMIAEMPGKLDHASVVAYRVGIWRRRPSGLTTRTHHCVSAVEGSDKTDQHSLFCLTQDVDICSDHTKESSLSGVHKSSPSFLINDAASLRNSQVGCEVLIRRPDEKKTVAQASFYAFCFISR